MKNLKIIKHFGNSSLEYADVKEKGYCVIDGIEIQWSHTVDMIQVHGDKIVIVEDKDRLPQYRTECDGLITALPDVFLCIRTADCYPIFLYDEQKGVVAALHSGRDSTKLNIIEKAILIMRHNLHCQDIKVEIGVGICTAHHQVSQDIIDDFSKTNPHSVIKGDCIDLKQTIINSALHNGIPPENITAIDDCTYENKNYFSFRRGDEVKRQISIIGITPVQKNLTKIT